MVKIFSVINLSKESPQQDSWAETPHDAIQKMQELHQQGADYIDVGARSSFSKSVEIDDRIEQERLESFFVTPRPKCLAPISLDTWSSSNALTYLPQIAVLNYTSTYFPEALISELANTRCPLVLNYLPADNPYALRKIPYSPPSIKAILDYFSVTVPYLEKKGLQILAIDPNLGMWHPQTPNELKPMLQKQIIEAIPELKKMASVFIVAPRTNNILNIQLSELLLSQGVDFIRTHDLLALQALIQRLKPLP
jgi:dihydropteroate synthase